MKKIILLSLILLTSCATVKKQSEDTEIKKDSASGSNKEWSLSTGNFTIKPFNPDKPIVHTNSEGKTDTFYNTIIENHYRTEYLKVKDTTNVKTDLKQEKTIKEKDYSEVINIVANKIILMLTIMFLIYLIYSYIKNKTPRL